MSSFLRPLMLLGMTDVCFLASIVFSGPLPPIEQDEDIQNEWLNFLILPQQWEVCL